MYNREYRDFNQMQSMQRKEEYPKMRYNDDNMGDLRGFYQQDNREDDEMRMYNRYNMQNKQEQNYRPRELQRVQNGQSMDIESAKEILGYDELVAQNQALQEHIIFLMNHIKSKNDYKSYEMKEQTITQIAQSLDIEPRKFIDYVENKLKNYPELKTQIDNPDFWQMMGDDMRNTQRPFIKPDNIISSTESKRVADSIISRAKRGEKISDAELGRAILNFR